MKTKNEEIAIWRDYVKVLYAMIRCKEYPLQVVSKGELHDGWTEVDFKIQPVNKGYSEQVTFQELSNAMNEVDMVYLTPDDYEDYKNNQKYNLHKVTAKIGMFKSLDEKSRKITLSIDNIKEFKSENYPVGGYLMPDYWMEKSNIRRMSHTIGKLENPLENGFPTNSNLADFLFNPENVRFSETPIISEFFNDKLNERQKSAVIKAMQADDLAIIQGPPGTGKTTVINEIVRQVVKSKPEARILITSQSNYAVDNVLEKLRKEPSDNIFPLRIGNNKKITGDGYYYAERVVNNWTEEKDNCLKSYADDIKGNGNNPDMNVALSECQEDIKDLFRKSYLDCVNVWVSTCCSSASRHFRELYESRYGKIENKNDDPWFDVVIVDEASKATPPELIMALSMGKKVIIIGDHLQLPPMYQERDMKEFLVNSGFTDLYHKIEKAIEKTMFEKIFYNIPINCMESLLEQYRSHSQIMACFNPFYQGKLISKAIDDERKHGIEWQHFIEEKDHAVWFNVKGEMKKEGTSSYNMDEVKAIEKILKNINNCDKKIGIITFYRAQMKRLKRVEKDYENVEVATVDKFQGMEKDIIIVSTVRGGNTCDLGFASIHNRMNVAMSRARNLLIVVGNMELFKRDKTYAEAIKPMKHVDNANF